MIRGRLGGSARGEAGPARVRPASRRIDFFRPVRPLPRQRCRAPRVTCLAPEAWTMSRSTAGVTGGREGALIVPRDECCHEPTRWRCVIRQSSVLFPLHVVVNPARNERNLINIRAHTHFVFERRVGTVGLPRRRSRGQGSPIMTKGAIRVKARSATTTDQQMLLDRRAGEALGSLQFASMRRRVSAGSSRLRADSVSSPFCNRPSSGLN